MKQRIPKIVECPILVSLVQSSNLNKVAFCWSSSQYFTMYKYSGTALKTGKILISVIKSNYPKKYMFSEKTEFNNRMRLSRLLVFIQIPYSRWLGWEGHALPPNLMRQVRGTMPFVSMTTSQRSPLWMIRESVRGDERTQDCLNAGLKAQSHDKWACKKIGLVTKTYKSFKE